MHCSVDDDQHPRQTKRPHDRQKWYGCSTESGRRARPQRSHGMVAVEAFIARTRSIPPARPRGKIGGRYPSDGGGPTSAAVAFTASTMVETSSSLNAG